MAHINRLRLVDDVRRNLEEAILCGEMRPGDRLPVAQVAEEFSVSLTTVREALLMLENQGLVVNKPRHGAFVTRLSEEEAQELCEARALLESFAVTVGFERIDAQFQERFMGLVGEMAECELPQDLPKLIRTDLKIHHEVISLADSARITELWTGLNGQIGALIMRGVEQQGSKIRDIVEFHRTLGEALFSEDINLARQEVVSHYLFSWSEYRYFATAVIQVADANVDFVS
ncbi:MAG: GntR family transcriptional regulator [Caldilineaceae bacterium]|nr:GntR family transcriptional regulator [Caldilineaceae bacterium]